MLRESETLTNGLLTLSVAHVFNPYRELASAAAVVGRGGTYLTKINFSKFYPQFLMVLYVS